MAIDCDSFYVIDSGQEFREPRTKQSPSRLWFKWRKFVYKERRLEVVKDEVHWLKRLWNTEERECCHHNSSLPVLIGF